VSSDDPTAAMAATPPAESRALTRADFSFDLPPDLIAQAPAEVRSGSRLLVLDGASGARSDRWFRELPSLLREGDVLVRNDTRVLPARLYGRKRSGGAVEILVERVVAERRFLAHVRASKGARPGHEILLPGDAVAVVAARRDDLAELELDRPVVAYLEATGEMPLPPYIDRAAGTADRERYQTVYARSPGAVAAPTAGLHFDAAILDACLARGAVLADVTLHVGAGTFQPVRVDDLSTHRMHTEWMSVPEATVATIMAARARGSRVVAVGTTVVRSLETAARSGRLRPFEGETDIFIRPGYRFQVVDALVTNFHLPESTLLMLVSAFAGREQVLDAYAHAVRERYRFYSYGDAMFIEPALGARAQS